MKSFHVKTNTILVANVQLKITADVCVDRRLLSAFIERYVVQDEGCSLRGGSYFAVSEVPLSSKMHTHTL